MTQLPLIIYIAGPYRGTNAWERESNIRDAERLALDVWSVGLIALCPHTNTRHFDGVLPDKVWLDGDLELLRRCDAVLVTPTWERSQGAKAEIAYAVQHNIPVFTTIPLLLQWTKVRDR